MPPSVKRHFRCSVNNEQYLPPLRRGHLDDDAEAGRLRGKEGFESRLLKVVVARESFRDLMLPHDDE